jgi:asparagine synthase (glutamine-hydrolysing)
MAWGSQGRNVDYLQNLDRLCFWGAGHLTTHRIRQSLFHSSLQPYDEEIRLNCQTDETNRNPLRTALDFDQRVRLPDDLLMRTDRASMFHSIEARVPYLDTHVLQCSARLTEQQCIRLGLFKHQTKRLLKQLAEKYIPRELIYRPKRGFDLPIATWLAKEFFQTSRQFLDEARIPALNYDFLCLLIEQGVGRNPGLIWAWIVLEKWYRNWIDMEAKHLCPEAAKANSTYTLLASS